MADHTTDRFTVLIGSEDYADHLIDIADVQQDEEPEKPKTGLLSRDWRPSVELMCSRGPKVYRTDFVSLSEYAAERDIDEINFDGDAPKGICSYCWSKTRKTLGEEAEREETGVADRIGTVGYRLRWKQKGRAREEWYDIIVRPETTMAELDTLVCRFTTLDGLHLRMYGLEDEYMDSSIEVVPDRQHSATSSNTKASEMTIAEVAEQANFWEGDRLSLVYDFGTPVHFYCIVKEICEPAELDSLLVDNDLIAWTETAAIVDEKRPQTH